MELTESSITQEGMNSLWPNQNQKKKMSWKKKKRLSTRVKKCIIIFFTRNVLNAMLFDDPNARCSLNVLFVSCYLLLPCNTDSDRRKNDFVHSIVSSNRWCILCV